MKTEVYIKFNDMLNDGKHTYEECYAWLMEQKNIEDMEFYEKYGFHPCNDFSYLYPEAIFWNDKELREEFIQRMKDIDTKEINNYIKKDNMDENAIRKIVKEYTAHYKTMKQRTDIDFTEFMKLLMQKTSYGARNIIEEVLDEMGISYEDGEFYMNDK